MIIDNIKNASLYYAINEGIAVALRYLQENDVEKMEPGDYEIDGSRIYVLVRHYQSKPVEKCSWEAHRRYIDVQYVAEGFEHMGYASIEHMETKEYINEKDKVVLQGDGNFIKMREGFFAVFFPDDVHMPCVAISESGPVKKVVIKVQV